MFCAVIVAAGNSRRAGFDKLSAPLAGVPVLAHSVRAFVQAKVNRIILVCPQERWDALRLWEYADGVSLDRVNGGVRRQDSVRAGLAAVCGDDCWVAVHDGARPLITPEAIQRCLDAAQRSGAAACAHVVVDTLKRGDEAGYCLPEQIDRTGMWGMETPQVARAGMLRAAYELLGEEEVTDEVTALQRLGVRPQFVQVGMNPKVTLPGDLEQAEAWCVYQAMRQ